MVFKCFLGVFTSVSDAYFKCSIYLLLYVATVAYRCFNSRSGVAHGRREESGQRRGRRSGQCGSTAGAFSREPNMPCARLLGQRGSVETLALASPYIKTWNFDTPTCLLLVIIIEATRGLPQLWSFEKLLASLLLAVHRAQVHMARVREIYCHRLTVSRAGCR
jgi:hypothetical protein